MRDNTVFVTGGSGFVGRRLIPALLEEGYRVRALARSARAAGIVANLGAEPVIGDLSDVDALRNAMAGCQLTIHGAARFRQDGDYAAYYQDNVVGTQHMLEAASSARVRRFLYIGAAGCLIGARPILNADESWPLQELQYSSYFRSKTVADRMVREADAEGFTTCVVRPAWVWGKGDPILESIAEATKQGKMLFIDGGKHPIVTSHVDNTVHGILLALRHEARGEAYCVFDDGTVQVRDFIGQMLMTQGLEAPDKAMPYIIAWSVASVLERAWKVLRRPGVPPVSRELVKMNGQPFVVSGSKAREELGYMPVISRREGIEQMRLRAASETGSPTIVSVQLSREIVDQQARP